MLLPVAFRSGQSTSEKWAVSGLMRGAVHVSAADGGPAGLQGWMAAVKHVQASRPLRAMAECLAGKHLLLAAGPTPHVRYSHLTVYPAGKVPA